MKTISNSRDAYEVLRALYERPEQEECYILCLDNAFHVRDSHLISVGSDTETIICKKVIAKYAVCDMACGVILSHSHPSGNPKPSEADIKETENLRKALALFDISLLDHIIVAGDQYWSFSDH